MRQIYSCDHDGEDRRHGGGKADLKQGHALDLRHEVGERDADQEGAQDALQGHEAGLAVAVQVAHDGEIDPDHDTVDGVGAQVVACSRAVIGVVGEQGS